MHTTFLKKCLFIISCLVLNGALLFGQFTTTFMINSNSIEIAVLPLDECAILACPTSDFDFQNSSIEALCSGETPSFPSNFTISDPDNTQIGGVVW